MSEGTSASDAVAAWFSRHAFRERPKGTARAVRAELARLAQERSQRLARERERSESLRRDLTRIVAVQPTCDPHRDYAVRFCQCTGCEEIREREIVPVSTGDAD